MLRLERRVAFHQIRPGEQQRVLGVPILDGLVMPDSPSNAIYRNVATLLEQLCPFLRPLLVDVVVSTLMRDSRRKQNRWGCSGKGLHKGRGRFGRQMLGHLQRYGQVKDAPKFKGLAQAERPEMFLRNLKEGSINIVAVNPKNVYYAEFPKDSEPASLAATDIHDTTYGEQLQHDRHDNLG